MNKDVYKVQDVKSGEILLWSIEDILNEVNHNVIADGFSPYLESDWFDGWVEGESYNLTSKPCITAHEYLDEFEQHAGIKIKRVPTPSWRYYSEALGKWAIKSIGRDPNAAFPSYADCQGRSFAATFDASKAEKELGWSPVQDRQTLVKEGIYAPVDEFVD